MSIEWKEQFQQRNFFLFVTPISGPIVCCLVNIFFCSLRFTASNFAHFLQSYWSVMNNFQETNAMCAQFICAKGVTLLCLSDCGFFWQRKLTILHRIRYMNSADNRNKIDFTPFIWLHLGSCLMLLLLLRFAGLPTVRPII